MELGFVQWINICGQNKKGAIVQIYDGLNKKSWWDFVNLILIIFSRRHCVLNALERWSLSASATTLEAA